MKISTLAHAGFLHVLPATAEYVWPSKYDRMEDLLVLQSGYIREGFADGISPCTRNPNSPGRQTAAEWIRTSFHDMATFDKATGTGGLDASIQFETDRPEDTGDAFNATLEFANNYFSIRTSAADLIALSTVLAVGNCGGPKIPLRVGRVDAKEAGAFGVPEPQQDLDTHTKMFAKAGFNTEEMIAMVACGHTMGGVHGKFFPEITEDNTETNVVHFDTSDATFDNNVATEYLDGTTTNPLVVAHNDTLNSDKRIFAADNNVTMKALADPKKFQSMCSDIFARMLDTVPSTTTLTEPIEPIALKPSITSFSLVNSTHIKFEGRIRLLTSNDRYDDELVTLSYTPRSAPDSNSTLNTTIVTRPAVFKLGTSNGIFGELFKWHEFSVFLPTDTSIKSFNTTVTRISTGAQTVYDNAGRGYPMDDTIMYQDAQSCRVDTAATLVAAVRKSVIDAGTPVVASMARKVTKQGTVVPAFQMEEWKGVLGKEVSDYVLVEIKGEQPPESFSTHFDLVAGESRVEYLGTNALGSKECTPF